MNTHQVDYSFVFGVASAVVSLFVMLSAGYAVKALWKTRRTTQMGRGWRKQ